MDTFEVKTLPRVDHDPVFSEDLAVLPPAAEARKVVGPYYEGELVLRLTFLQGFQGPYRVLGRGQQEFDVINPDVKPGMSLDGLHCCQIPFVCTVCTDRVLYRILWRHDKIDPVEVILPREVLHYGLVADVEGIEGS